MLKDVIEYIQRDPSRCVGVDITDKGVYMVELCNTRSGVKLVAYGHSPYEKQAVRNGEILDEEAVVTAVEQAYLCSRFHTRTVCTLTQGSSIVTHIVPLPHAMEEEEIAEFADVESVRKFGNQLSSLSIDYNIINANAEGGNGELILVAGRMEEINKRVEIIEEAGLYPAIIEVNYFIVPFICRALLLKNNASVEKTLLFIHISADKTQFVVIENSIVVYTRESDIHINITEENAKDNLINAIERVSHFFYSASQIASLDMIVIAGDSISSEVISGVNQHFNIETVECDFLNLIEVSEAIEENIKKDKDNYLMAFGLALRGVSSDNY